MTAVRCFGSVGACPGTSVVTVVATDADDPTYGNSARLMYSILQGQPYFSVEPKTGDLCNPVGGVVWGLVHARCCSLTLR